MCSFWSMSIIKLKKGWDIWWFSSKKWLPMNLTAHKKWKYLSQCCFYAPIWQLHRWSWLHLLIWWQFRQIQLIYWTILYQPWYSWTSTKWFQSSIQIGLQLITTKSLWVLLSCKLNLLPKSKRHYTAGPSIVVIYILKLFNHCLI